MLSVACILLLLLLDTIVVLIYFCQILSVVQFRALPGLPPPKVRRGAPKVEARSYAYDRQTVYKY